MASPLRISRASGVFYDRLKDMEQTIQDMNLARRQGDMARYREIYEDNWALLQYKDFIKKQQRNINDLNARINEIRYSRFISSKRKAEQLDRLYQLRNDALDTATKHKAFATTLR